jgi:hypothetical protein
LKTLLLLLLRQRQVSAPQLIELETIIWVKDRLRRIIVLGRHL